MSLTTNVRNRLLDAINSSFKMIGDPTDPAIIGQTKMPRLKTKDNRAPIAWEYFVSSHLASLARARFDAAKKLAITAGVIFDHEKNPREPGTNETVYNGEHVSIMLTVNQPASRIDADKMGNYLIAHGVDAKLVAEAADAASTRIRPAHVFRVSLIATSPAGK